jgi:predicted outer membrane repeat protein
MFNLTTSVVRLAVLGAVALGVAPLTALGAADADRTVAAPAATTFTVTNTNDSGPGSLRQAIADANSVPGPDTIRTTAQGTVHLASTLLITDEVTLLGPGADLFAVDGGGAMGVFRIRDDQTVNGEVITLPVPASLADLTVQNGFATRGGGIQNIGGLTLTNVNLIDNRASDIGGGADVGGPVTLIGGRFAGNRAQGNGGGLYAHSTLNLTGTQFLSNSGGDAGGAALVLEGAQIDGGRFENNHCSGSHCIGGGLIVILKMTMTDTQFFDNTATEAGGGLFFEGGKAHIAGSRFVGNTASVDGGGAYIGLGGLLTRLRTHGKILSTRSFSTTAHCMAAAFLSMGLSTPRIGASALWRTPCSRATMRSWARRSFLAMRAMAAATTFSMRRSTAVN